MTAKLTFRLGRFDCTSLPTPSQSPGWVSLVIQPLTTECWGRQASVLPSSGPTGHRTYKLTLSVGSKFHPPFRISVWISSRQLPTQRVQMEFLMPPPSACCSPSLPHLRRWQHHPAPCSAKSVRVILDSSLSFPTISALANPVS